MYRIIGNQRQRGLDWAVPRLNLPSLGSWDRASCLIHEKDLDIIACVVYNHFDPGNAVELSVAAEGDRWLTRPFLHAVFSNPFDEWQLRRVWSVIDADNLKSIRLCEHLGFVQEGRLRQAAGPKIDRLLFGMLREECRYLGREYSESKTIRAAGARSDRDRERTNAVKYPNIDRQCCPQSYQPVHAIR